MEKTHEEIKITLLAEELGEHSLYPYDNVEKFWYFVPNKKLYQLGPPQMTDRDLIVAICEEKGWKLK